MVETDRLSGMHASTFNQIFAAMTLLAALLLTAGCGSVRFHPDRATRPYPVELHTANSVDIQVFRDGTTIELRNATPVTYRDFDLWINQRYVSRVAALPAGEAVRLSLWDFYDERGETMIAGGLFRTYPATPVRLVQIQIEPEAPLIGLVTIRAETAD